MTPIDAQRRLGVKADGVWGPATAEALLKALPGDAGLRAVRLSPNVTLGEMIRSDTADRRKLRNHPSPAQLLSMVALCEAILEPVRARFGPVRVTSGFRIFTPESQHGRGEAADFEVTGVSNLLVARWIRDTLPFDQLILEAWAPGDPNAGWIHCSHRRAGGRRSVLRTPTGRAPYHEGLPK